jgi:prophage regulatory protein
MDIASTNSSTVDRFVREPERREITGLARSTWFELERQGRVPKRHQLSQSAVGWKLSDLLAWVESRQPKRAA